MDMAQVIVPKSDQLNADDLIAGPMTIKITAVTIRGGQEQPIAISFEGDNGKPYKACKSMCRVMVTAWGPDSSKYTGRSLTLYREPTVKWGGMEVGGIRISHMSDIKAPLTLALTMTRANKKPYTVKPIDEPPAKKVVTPEQKREKALTTFAEIGVDETRLRVQLGKDISEATPAELSAAYAFFDEATQGQPGASI